MTTGMRAWQGRKRMERNRGDAEGRPPLLCQKSKKTARLEVKSALPADKPVPT